MADVASEQIRRRIAAIGAVPFGSFEARPKDWQAKWSFRWPGPGTPETLAVEIFALFEQLGIEQKAWGPDRHRVRGTDSDAYSGNFLAPVRSLTGDLSSMSLAMHMNCQPTPLTGRGPSGHRNEASLVLTMVNHWFAPLSDGLFHDNRAWSLANRPFVRELFDGLASLGLSHFSVDEGFQLSPLTAHGFADVNFDWLKNQVSDRWRGVVEDGLPLDAIESNRWQLDLPPKFPKGNPSWWRLFGFNHSDDEVFALFEGVPGGQTAASRVLPWISIVRDPQVVGDNEKLLALGLDLRRQLADALKGVEDDLALRLRSLPVVLAGDHSSSGKGRIGCSEISDLLISATSRPDRQVSKLYRFETSRMTYSDTGKLVSAHLAGPVLGADWDLSAALELWGHSGTAQITEDAFVVGIDLDSWAHPKLEP